KNHDAIRKEQAQSLELLQNVKSKESVIKSLQKDRDQNEKKHWVAIENIEAEKMDLIQQVDLKARQILSLQKEKDQNEQV
ncbi:hypothetical protein MAR_032970, partial [Mya arenaria]